MTSLADGNKLVKYEDVKNPREHTIALYHARVTGCENELGTLIDGDVTLNDFDNYNLVLLGDIHKYQYLDEEKTVCYPSSLICQNFAESPTDHGCVKWDLTNYSSKLKKIKNEYAYFVVNVNKGKYKIPENITLHPRIKLKIKETKKERVKEIEDELSANYEMPEGIVKTFEDSELSKLVTNNIETTNINIEKAIKTYLKNAGHKKETREKIIELNKEIKSKVSDC